MTYTKEKKEKLPKIMQRLTLRFSSEKSKPVSDAAAWGKALWKCEQNLLNFTLNREILFGSCRKSSFLGEIGILTLTSVCRNV